MPDCLSSRDIDIYLPLFCIAKFIDTKTESSHIENDLSEYAIEMSALRNDQDIEENLSYKLITDLYFMVKEEKVKAYKNDRYINDEVLKYLTDNCEYDFLTKALLTKTMNNLQIKHLRVVIEEKKRTCYVIKLEHLEKLIDSYNITIPEDV